MSNVKEARRISRYPPVKGFHRAPRTPAMGFAEAILSKVAGVAALIAALEQRDVVSDREKEALNRLSWRARDYPRGAEIVADRSRPSESCLLTAGLAGRSVLLRNGTRQLTALHVPGDFVDYHALLIRIMDHAVVALTDCKVLFADHAELRQLAAEEPHLHRMLSMTVAIDAAVQRAWMVGLGRRNPSSHLAHLLCELYLRLEVVGMVEDHGFDFRIGQTELADMLGLSVVHTNRTVQDLRAQKLVSWKNGRVTIHDFAALARLGDFDPVYLNLFREQR
jgi:CRP-like cAMP-binding protein